MLGIAICLLGLITACFLLPTDGKGFESDFRDGVDELQTQNSSPFVTASLKRRAGRFWNDWGLVIGHWVVDGCMDAAR